MNILCTVVRRYLYLLTFILLLFSLTACTSFVPRERLPFPLATKDSPEQIKVVTIPLPAIGASPNEGITYGTLTAFLIHNAKDEVSALIAPQINQNENFGTTGSLYGAFYPTPERYIEMNISKSSKINEDYELKYRDTSFFNHKMEVNAFLYRFADGSARFFGFEARTPQQMESNYTDEETGFTLSAGYRFGKHYQLILGERFRDVNIKPGAVKKVPYIKTKFSETDVPGINGFTVHAQRISLVYSTLDSRDMPTFGGYFRFTFEPSMKALGSSANYRHYEVETKGYLPLDNARYVSVFRFVYNQTLSDGENVPFLEQSILGGETTLRGYGRNRFIDNSFLLCNLEERIRLFRWEIFNVNADWELAPFVDFGAVMESLPKATGRNFEFNPGLGLRAVVRPNIVGRIDVGIGRDGPSVFVGLGYPF